MNKLQGEIFNQTFLAYRRFTCNYKTSKLKVKQHLRRNSQANLDTAMNGFNLCHFNTRMKKMAAQFSFYWYPNAVLSPELFGA